jgi:hypothetical protein
MLIDAYKDGEVVETIELSASKRIYKVGRQAGFADIVLSHGSISREHATLTVSASGSVVVMDMGSAHGTKLSGKKIPPRKSHLLPPGRSLVFGQSTRIFKLREGGTGFVSGAVAAEVVPAAAADLSDPRLQALLSVLRNGAPQICRLRPDGFCLATAVMRSPAVTASGATEAELPQLLARAKGVIDAVYDGNVMLLRAVEGHADTIPIDTSSRFRPTSALPEIVIHGAKFKEWNRIRSSGIRSASGPIRLCTEAPPKGTALISLGGGKAEVLVHLNVSSLAAEGIELFEALGGEGGEADQFERLASTGDDDGLIGAWHIDKVVNARDGSELMSAEEVVPLRAARERELTALADKAADVAAKQAEKQRRASLEAERREALEAQAAAQAKADAPRFNPYLAHMDDAPVQRKASNRSAAEPTLARKRKKGGDYDDYE